MNKHIPIVSEKGVHIYKLRRDHNKKVFKCVKNYYLNRNWTIKINWPKK